jgi:hypothetical protein
MLPTRTVLVQPIHPCPDRGRDQGLNPAPPSEPDGRISRIRLSSQWVRNHTMARSQPCAAAKDSGPRGADPGGLPTHLR